MASGFVKIQGSNWDVNMAVLLYLAISNGLLRWTAEMKVNELAKLSFILKIFYAFGVLSNIYFLKTLSDHKEESVFNIGILGFKLKAFGMLETFLSIIMERARIVNPMHFMDYCGIVTFVIIFANGNRK